MWSPLPLIDLALLPGTACRKALTWLRHARPRKAKAIDRMPNHTGNMMVNFEEEEKLEQQEKKRKDLAYDFSDSSKPFKILKV